MTGISKVAKEALAAGAPGRENLPAGTVLQVVNGTYSTETTTSSPSWSSTGLAASITPTSTSSKILVSVSPNIYFGSSNSIGCGLRIDRSGTAVYTTGLINNVNAITILSGSYSIDYLDSPSTTSSITYTLQFNCPFANSPYAYPTINGNDFNGPGLYTASTITLMEIAA